MTLAKPAYGAPCNGCGICCIVQPCILSTALFGQQDQCPALEQVDQSFGCGLIRDTAAYVPGLPSWGGAALTEAFALMLGAGSGCDSFDDADRVEAVEAAWPAEQARAAASLAAASPEAQELVGYFRAPA